jgi:hypothetical protein
MFRNITFVIVNFVIQEKRQVGAALEPSSEILVVFGIKEEVTGAWTKLYNEGLHNLYSSTNIVRVIYIGRMRNVCLVA